MVQESVHCLKDCTVQVREESSVTTDLCVPTGVPKICPLFNQCRLSTWIFNGGTALMQNAPHARCFEWNLLGSLFYWYSTSFVFKFDWGPNSFFLSIFLSSEMNTQFNHWTKCIGPLISSFPCVRKVTGFCRPVNLPLKQIKWRPSMTKVQQHLIIKGKPERELEYLRQRSRGCPDMDFLRTLVTVYLLQSHCTRGLQYSKQSDRTLTGSRLITASSCYTTDQ